MALKTFKRKELKYFVTPVQYDMICEAFSDKMIIDKFCKNERGYMIYNLYFDTANNDIIRHSISKPYYKEKLRLRSYRIPVSGEEKVYLELKRKIGGVVAKRRAVMTYGQAMDFVDNGIMPKANNYQDGQVYKEIADFLARNKVTPKVYIGYERMAFFHKANSDFRVSFDRNIVTRRDGVNLLSGNRGSLLLPEGRYLMEVKCVGAIPLWFCRLLSEMKLYKTSFSKYGTEYKQFVRTEYLHSRAS